MDEILGGPLLDSNHLAQEIDQLAVDLASFPGLGRLVPILRSLLKFRARSFQTSLLRTASEPGIAPAGKPEEDEAP